MKVGTGFCVKAMTDALRGVFAKHPNVTVEHVLAAIEKLRYTVTEEAILRAHPELRKSHPLDKRVPHELRPQQKRPPDEDLDRPIRA